MQLYFAELRLLFRERTSWVLIVLFAAALAYGVWNGHGVAAERAHAAGVHVDNEATFQRQTRQQLGTRTLDPRRLARSGSVAVLPPAPMPYLATGQSDIAPGHERFSLWRLNKPGGTRSGLSNPSHLLAGRFDLAFVIVWLYPLFLLGLIYDLMAGDRESGTLRLALSQGIRPWQWVTRRAIARSAPLHDLALIATLVACWLGSPGEAHAEGSGDAVNSGVAWQRTLWALAVVLAYGLFWTALAALVNALTKSAAAAATSLGAAWVGLVLVVPTLLNLSVESLYPTPSRAELIALGRNTAGSAEKRVAELLDSFYVDHPELAPPGQRGDAYTARLAVQEEVARKLEPLQTKFAQQLAEQQAAIGKWRFLSSAIATQEALTDLAGTGYWRHAAFREQAGEFRKEIAAFYGPLVHRREMLDLEGFENMPRFAFEDEPPAELNRRVGASLAGILGGALLLALAACWFLRARRLAPLAS